MVLEGVVTNVAAFGGFVNLVYQDGLAHLRDGQYLRQEPTQDYGARRCRLNQGVEAPPSAACTGIPRSGLEKRL